MEMLIIMMGSPWRWIRFSKWQALLLAFFTLSTYQIDAWQSDLKYKCPLQCKCKSVPDMEKGHVLRTQCLDGGLHSIPIVNMDPRVFILQVGAPEDRPNNLTIGPILTHPAPFKQLRNLQIINSNVPSIGKHAFWGLVNLKSLNLSHNEITTIEQENFRGLINLKELDLSYNRIDEMASDTFIHCSDLKKLYLSHNNITILNPRLFRTLAELKTLDLSGNPIEDLNPEVFKDIQQLTILKCRNCLISRINGQVYYLLSNLYELDLGYNQMKYVLIDDFRDLKKLRKIYLDGNQISVLVDYVFHKNVELREINIANNQLALLCPNSLYNLTRLYHLDIGYNNIERFDLQTFAPVVQSLRELTLSGNNQLPLNELTIVMETLPKLEDVRLANLSLTEIPPNLFRRIKSLTFLDVSWNNLTEFPLKVITKAKSLHNLDISHNHLTKLEDEDLHRLEMIPNIRLSHNKWKCNQCSIGMMLVYMRTTVLNETLRNLRCDAPENLSGIPLWNVSFEILEECTASQEAQGSVIASLMLVLVAALATVTGTLYCTRRRAQQRYYTHEEKRGERDPEHPEELLPHTDLGDLASTNAPFSDLDNNS